MTSYQLLPSLCHVLNDMTLLQNSRHRYSNIRTRIVSLTLHEDRFSNKHESATEQLRAQYSRSVTLFQKRDTLLFTKLQKQTCQTQKLCVNHYFSLSDTLFSRCVMFLSLRAYPRCVTFSNIARNSTESVSPVSLHLCQFKKPCVRAISLFGEKAKYQHLVFFH